MGGGGQDQDAASSSGEVRTLIELPEGAVPLEVVEICGYLDEEGMRRWSVRYSADVPLSTTIGLLRIAEHRILTDATEWPP